MGEIAKCLVCESNFSPAQANSIPYCKNRKLENPKNIVFCPQCGFGTLFPTLSSKELEELYQGGEFWGKGTEIPKANLRVIGMHYTLAQSRWNYIQSRWSEMPQSVSILDIGAGYGCLGLVAARELGQRLKEYVVVEPDPKIVHQLRAYWAQFAGNSKLRTFSTLEELKGEFDLVVLSHVMEHLTDPTPFIEEVKKRMAPSGRFFIEIPNQDFRYHRDNYGHVQFFAPVHLEKYLRNQNFVLQDLSGFGLNPDQTPLNGASKTSRKTLEKVVYKARRGIPLSLLSVFYRHLYGVDHRNPSGTWIRALVGR